MTDTVNCPRCQGRGHIEAFAHYANGVCFLCGGTKTVTIDRDKMIAKLSDDTRKRAEWVLQTTPDSYVGLPYAKLLKIRDFCHGGWGIPKAYPTLRNHWFENGEAAFQAAQAERLAAY